jgi:peroxiredoxin
MEYLKADPNLSLSEQLSATARLYKVAVPAEKRVIIDASKADAFATFDPSTAIKTGDRLPDFCLPNAQAQDVTLESLLARGRPVLFTFYRGPWCPFCNLALRQLQKRLPDFTAAGADLVAVSPELPDSALSTAEMHELGFEVLSDKDNVLSRKLGILWRIPEDVRPFIEARGGKWEASYGKEEMDVPLPTTLLVDRDGVVQNVYIEPDYFQRLDPAVALEWVKALKVGT